ncbi:MAG: hypothetical protein D6712_14285 [Chloroflexi bacterium]|nr:MAG: hypothetical protein D6712_14285 [Chloroflexota bacterium]
MPDACFSGGLVVHKHRGWKEVTVHYSEYSDGALTLYTIDWANWWRLVIIPVNIPVGLIGGIRDEAHKVFF